MIPIIIIIAYILIGQFIYAVARKTAKWDEDLDLVVITAVFWPLGLIGLVFFGVYQGIKWLVDVIAALASDSKF